MMRPYSGLTGREKAIELLRWICVLPAAMLGSFATYYIGGLVGRLAQYGWGTPVESTLVYYLLLLLFYIPKEAAFVIAGAKTAPRSRLATTTVLAVARLVMSLIVHVLKQPNPGVVNYTHFTAESAGVAFGIAYIFYSEKMKGTPQ
jgi:hypothetical protein